jgi:hypothetical protein
MSVARISGPQLLDATLRTTQQTVDQEAIRVGCHLRRDPGDEPHEGGCQCLLTVELALEARQRYLHLLSLSVLSGAFCHQHDAGLCQSTFQRRAAVGQVPKELPCCPLLQDRLGKEFLGQGDVRDVGGGELVGDS